MSHKKTKSEAVSDKAVKSNKGNGSAATENQDINTSHNINKQSKGPNTKR